ncbi:hypothetical protein EXW59_01385 (plasmid) [Bacillus mycoides]|uniref:insecticidal delta-endotoxin Cry8Ea1 family protein n=1 Tax=Bacillus mycoides TaxID=1405 RepID=UPI001C037E5F|nr:insecticidal delta-endotoxin Cry8Ea1 family protein [Bacillus mycoides]QWH75541.1 hypothetical protein EXW59_01385 [Bacillus mycoides]
MNSNDNNNYEIIDSNASPYSPNRNNEYSRYPYAHNPDQPLQNTNYKDWLNNCQGNQIYDGSPESFADAETIAAVSAGIIVVGTMLGAFTAPITAGVIISFGTLLPLIWKSEEEAKIIWQQFTMIGNRPFNTVTDQAIINLLTDRIRGLQSPIHEYNRLFNDWKAKRESNVARALLSTFDNIHLEFGRELQGTLSGQYKIQMLPGYAQVANWHLNLLQQASIHYDEWLKDSRKPAEIYFEENVTPSNELQTCLNTCASSNGTANSAYYKCLLKCHIKEYTNYCIKTYNDGLTMLKNQKNISWSIYNTYRREITLTVLDLVALFPNYDPDYYSRGVKSELTRIIYTNANSDTFRTMTQLEEALTLEPSLFFSRISLNFFTRNFRDYLGYEDIFAFTANQVLFEYSNNSNQRISSPIYGNYIGTDILKNISFNMNSINMIKVDRHREYPTIIKNIKFFSNNTEISSYSTNSSLEPNYLKTDIFMIPKAESNHETYNHKLAYMKTDNYITNIKENQERNFAFGWTYENVDYNNTIRKNIITSIPAVKAFQISSDSRIERGPGHTGGDLVRLQNSMQLQVTFASDMTQTYKIRIRYASNLNLNVTLQVANVTQRRQIVRTFIGNKNSNNLLYEDFGYHEFSETLGPPGVTTRTIILQSVANNLDQLFIDKIEFIPITQQYLETSEKEKIKTIQQRINDVFLDPQHQSLQTKTTDYEIDQLASEIETLSDEWYPQEKMMLLNEIKHAKQLSLARNLLQNGNFEGWMGWTTINDSTIQTGNPNFKGNALHMPGARTTDINNTVFPTYVYQKIDESKLKPYTRYRVRGFIASSKNLELYITRYNQEIHTMMNISDNVIYRNSYEQTNTILQASTRSDDSCHCETTQMSSLCQDPQAFSFFIDTGDLHINENLGIFILFKISDPDGYAILGNLEVIEDQPLTEEDNKHIRETEKIWNQTKENQQKETEQIYSQAQQAVNNLFSNNQMLRFETTMADIIKVDSLIDTIPYVYNKWVPTEPGMNYQFYTDLKNQISQAYSFYDRRNIVKNGSFTNGLAHWQASSDAYVQQMDTTSVLVLPNWSTQVSQQIKVHPNHRYLLRVIAKKEENGTGTIQISNCSPQIETLAFQDSDNINQNMWENDMGYLTKTMVITPDTNQVRIDIGETEGTFKISSVEFICTN